MENNTPKYNCVYCKKEILQDIEEYAFATAIKVQKIAYHLECQWNATHDYGDYEKYQHVEYLNGNFNQGLLNGNVYFFDKLDGTNGKIWYDKDTQTIKFGSRNRELKPDKPDNADFRTILSQDNRFKNFFKKYPAWILYGEWLVKHIIEYKEEAWKRFYVFDVCYYLNGKLIYLPYVDYKKQLDYFGIDYIPAITNAINPTLDKIKDVLSKANFMLKEGNAEGIVLKNYQFYNRFGGQIWGKVLAADFKEKHSMKKFDLTIFEEKVVAKYLTPEWIEKEFHKLTTDQGMRWNPSMTPEFLKQVFNEFLIDFLPAILREYKKPTINFSILNKILNSETRMAIKEISLNQIESK